MPSPNKRKRESLDSSLSPNTEHSGGDATADEQGLFTDDRFYLVDVNLVRGTEHTVPQLVQLIESNGGTVTSVDSCTVVITTLRSMRRLSLHLPSDFVNAVNNRKSDVEIVSPKWIIDCVSQNTRLSTAEYTMISSKPSMAKQSSTSVQAENSDENLLEPDFTRPETPEYDPNAIMSCKTLCPLVSPNEDIASRLALISNSRALDGEDRSSLSYSRAVAAIKSVPFRLKSGQAHDIARIGSKVGAMVEEYLSNGHIATADAIEKSERFQCLSTFTEVNGIGPHKARQLYAAGCRTLEDLEKPPHNIDLTYYEDFGQKIPREEVIKISEEINNRLQDILPGAIYTICGGFRRGKPMSNDVDIVFSHPTASVQGLLDNLIHSLSEYGLLIGTVQVIKERNHSQENKSPVTKRRLGHLDLCLGVIKWPINPKPNETVYHRRIDIIVADIRNYWTAIVGWTGSTLFERDLRLAAQKRGLKFDSGGITRQSDKQELIASSEQQVFSLLGLPYIPPTWRNADVSR